MITHIYLMALITNFNWRLWWKKAFLCEQMMKYCLFENFWWIYVVSDDNIIDLAVPVAEKVFFLTILCQFLNCVYTSIKQGKLSKSSIPLLFLYQWWINFSADELFECVWPFCGSIITDKRLLNIIKSIEYSKCT